MAEKFLIDIKRTKKSEPLVLDKSVAGSESLKIPHKLAVEPRRNPAQENFTPLNAQPSAQISRFSGLYWIGIFGLIIVFLINALNSYGRGVMIISDIAKSGTGIQQKLSKINEELWFLDEADISEKISQYIADAGQNLAEISKNIDKIGSVFMQKNSEEANAVSISDEIKKLGTSYENFLKNISNMEEAIKNIDTTLLPADLIEKINKLRSEMNRMRTLIPEASVFIKGLEALLGIDKPHKALILLQNDSESRPTGGFIGSVLFAQVNQGRMSLTFQDVYDIDRGFDGNIEPPEEIKNLTDKWFFRDSNYSPDFPVSARKAIWFYEQEKHIKVDTVIAINQSLLRKLLDITGPVAVPGLAHPLDKNNYQTVISYIVESKLTVPYEPKKVLRDFIEVFQKQFYAVKEPLKIANIFLQEIAANNILAYSDIAEVENLFKFIGMDGMMITPTQNEDYLNVIATSINGNKTDSFIEQEISHTTYVYSNGELINEVSISRHHNYSRADEAKIKNILANFGYTDVPEWIMEIFGKARNKTIFRVYVPAGSELIAAGAKTKNVKTLYDKDTAKTYFSFMMNVHPGQTITASLRYKLPFKFDYVSPASYRLIAQRQPGLIISKFTKKIVADSSLKILYSYPINTEKIPLTAYNLFAALISG